MSFVLVIVVCLDVLFRYLFNASQVWIIELEWHLFGVLFLLCGAWTWLENRHVGVDVIHERLSKQGQLRLRQIGHAALALPWICVVTYASFTYATYALQWNEGSPDPGGLPARYLIKYVIFFGFCLMLCVALWKLFWPIKKSQ